MKFSYIVDSSFEIPESFENNEVNKRIHFVPLIVIDPKNIEYNDPKTTIAENDLVKIMKEFPKTPLTTSLSPQGFLENKIRELLKTNDYVIGLALNKTLSNQFALFQKVAAMDEFKGKFLTLSERNIPMMSYLIILEFEERTKKMKTLSADLVADVLAKINENQSATTYVLVTSLDRLVAGGRLSKAKATFAKMGKLKITLRLEEKGLDKFAVNRSLLKSVNDCIETSKKDSNLSKDKLLTFVMFFGTQKEDKDEVLKTINGSTKDVYYSENNPLPSILAAHLGIKSLAIITVNIKDTFFLEKH